ncbi:hypothetical protein SUDANB105_07990 [Streptomyces sp. enrichment culture]|uniref:hypothetical protein n=1 Tax=Streptomyces sp. enrichment culture TaxID=1795815 RepID=UPI003F567815
MAPGTPRQGPGRTAFPAPHDARPPPGAGAPQLRFPPGSPGERRPPLFSVFKARPRGPIGRDLLGGDFPALPETEQAACTWPADHFNAEGHEHSDRIMLSSARARTTTLGRLSKAARPAARA